MDTIFKQTLFGETRFPLKLRAHFSSTSFQLDSLVISDSKSMQEAEQKHLYYNSVGSSRENNMF
jgi:hypothetical protein